MGKVLLVGLVACGSSKPPVSADTDAGGVTPGGPDDGGVEAGVPFQAPQGSPLAAGKLHTCAVASGGHVFCWGDNSSGQLGDGTTNEAHAPVAVKDLAGVVAITTGTAHSCAINADGSVACWGSNANGQLGTGDTNDSITPVVLPRPRNVVAIAAGDLHTCALKSGGGASCWGSNYQGRLGNGGGVNSPSPVAVSGLTDGVALAAGPFLTCAVEQSGTMGCWGSNQFGEVGDGTTAAAVSPSPVTGIARAIQSASGAHHTCLLGQVGVSCWGLDADGQLGTGPSGGTTPTPVRVVATNLAGVTLVAAGGYHACALNGDATVWCWGSNKSGQLGNGAATTAPTPLPVKAKTDRVIAVAGGDQHTCALRDDGTIACWGGNANGALGNGTTVDSASPVSVTGFPR